MLTSKKWPILLYTLETEVSYDEHCLKITKAAEFKKSPWHPTRAGHILYLGVMSILDCGLVELKWTTQTQSLLWLTIPSTRPRYLLLTIDHCSHEKLHTQGSVQILYWGSTISTMHNALCDVWQCSLLSIVWNLLSHWKLSGFLCTCNISQYYFPDLHFSMQVFNAFVRLGFLWVQLFIKLGNLEIN